MTRERVLNVVAAITAIIVIVSCNSEKKYVFSYDSYITPKDEYGEEEYIVYRSIKKKSANHLLAEEGWNVHSETTVSGEESTYARKGKSLEITFPVKNEHHDVFALEKEVNIDIVEFNTLTIRTRGDNESAISVVLTIDGEEQRVIPNHIANGKWQTVRKLFLGGVLSKIRIEAHEPDGYRDVNMVVDTLSTEIDTLSFETVQMVEGPGKEEAVNLIVDGSFEEQLPGVFKSPSPWTTAVPGSTKVSWAITNEGAYDGTNCLKMNVEKIDTVKRYVMIVYNNFDAQEGKTYRFTAWVRGEKLGQPLKMRFRQATAPYAEYNTKSVSVGTKWKKVSFEQKTGGSVRVRDLGFDFMLTSSGILYIDGISITEVKEKPLTKGNLIYNGSFEVGLEGWGTRYQANDRGHVKLGDGSERIGKGVVGEQCLKILVPNFENKPRNFGVWTTSMFFRAVQDKPVVLSFWAKLTGQKSGSVRIHAKIRDMEKWNHQDGGFYVLEDEWKRYEIPLTVPKSTKGLYYLFLDADLKYDRDGWIPITNNTNDALFFIDGIQLEYGEEASEFRERDTLTIGFGTVDGHPEDRMYIRDEDLSAAMLMKYVALRGTSLPYTVEDVYGKFIAQGTFKYKKGTHEDVYNLPHPSKNGSFKVVIYNVKKTKVIAEYIYHILPYRHPVAWKPDSMFGGHFRLNDYSLKVAQKIGIRHVRDFLSSPWRYIEPVENDIFFNEEMFELAKKYKLKVMPMFFTSAFYASSWEEGMKRGWLGGCAYPPKKEYMHRWTNYVTNFLLRYPYIDNFQFWNEPDLSSFFTVGPGTNKLEAWLELLGVTYDLVREHRPDAKLIPQLCAYAKADWNKAAFEREFYKKSDGFSFHYYSGVLPSDLDDSPLDYTRDWVKTLALKSPERKIDIWMDEGGIPRVANWYDARKPLGGFNLLESMRWVIWSHCEFIGAGSTKVFYYQAFVMGRYTSQVELANFNMVFEWDGIPSPLASTYAVMTWLLEGKKYTEYKKDENDIESYTFKGESEKVMVVMKRMIPSDATERHTLRDVKAKKVIDMQGNVYPFEQTEEGVTIDFPRWPLFIVQ